MSYAFNNIMSAMNLTENQDIFDGQGQTENGQNQSTSKAPSFGLTSSSEGDLGPSTQGASGQPSPVAVAPVQKGNAGRVMAKNQGKAQRPVDIQGMSTSISDAKTKLQAEADSYVQGAAQPYQKSQEQIKADVQNFADTGNEEFMSAYTQRPNAVSPLELKTDTNVSNIDLLRNDSGIKELFRRRGDAEYSAGEAALDSALMRQDKQFQLDRDAVLNSYRDLLKSKDDIVSSSPEKAQKAQDSAYDAWKLATTGELDAIGSQIKSANEAEERAFDEALAAEELRRKQGIYNDAQSYLEDMATRYDDPYLKRYLVRALGEGTLDSNGLLDASQFYDSGMGIDKTSADDFYDDQESLRFNNIMGVLGRGGDAKLPGRFAGKAAKDVIGGGLRYSDLANAALGYANPRAEIERTYDGGRAADEEAKKRGDIERSFLPTVKDPQAPIIPGAININPPTEPSQRAIPPVSPSNSRIETPIIPGAINTNMPVSSSPTDDRILQVVKPSASKNMPLGDPSALIRAIEEQRELDKNKPYSEPAPAPAKSSVKATDVLSAPRKAEGKAQNTTIDLAKKQLQKWLNW